MGGARTQAEIESDNDLTPDYVAVLSLMASTVKRPIFCVKKIYGGRPFSTKVLSGLYFGLCQVVLLVGSLLLLCRICKR